MLNRRLARRCRQTPSSSREAAQSEAGEPEAEEEEYGVNLNSPSASFIPPLPSSLTCTASHTLLGCRGLPSFGSVACWAVGWAEEPNLTALEGREGHGAGNADKSPGAARQSQSQNTARNNGKSTVATCLLAGFRGSGLTGVFDPPAPGQMYSPAQIS
eukprot:760933-Hanusia_phi.AAC.1